MKVSEHFDSEEFDQHAGYGLPATPYPKEWLTDPTRLPALLVALEKVRGHFGKPIKVLSGYRSVEYNDREYRAQGKVPTDSQHSRGRAADIIVPGVAASDVHAFCLAAYKAGELQIGGLGEYSGFTHVDVRLPDPNRPNHLARWQG
jgi:uncharacterized protein YcbK (DUF882 family)